LKKNHLTKNGTEVREFYLTEALKLVQKYGVVRAHTLAFGLFPNRIQKAATAAAQRVLANATEAGYLRAKADVKTRRMYYALTISGARYLNEVAPECSAKGTQMSISGQYFPPVSVQFFPLYRHVENDFYCV